MAVKYSKLGPGTLTLGEVGTAVDYACQLTGSVVAWDASKDDDTPTLCGDSVPGATTYTATFSGTAVQDLGDPAGLVAFTWENKGQEVALTFTPNTVDAAVVTGTVIINPLDVGGDTAGDNMTSDFEWSFVGDPVLDQTGGALADAQSERLPIDA
jgi:hypothetical protein